MHCKFSGLASLVVCLLMLFCIGQLLFFFYIPSIYVLMLCLVISVAVLILLKVYKTAQSRVEKESLAQLEQEYSLQNIFEQMPIGVVLNNATGERIYVNPYWQKLTGLSAGLAKENGWRKAIHPDDLARVEQAWQGAFHEAKTAELEWRFLREDGETRWMRGALLPLYDKDGQIQAYIGVMDDITEIRIQEGLLRANRVELQKAHAELDGVLNGSLDPILSINQHFDLMVCNAAYMTLLDTLYGIKAAVGENMAQYMAPFVDDWNKLHALWKKALNGEQVLERLVFGDRTLHTYDVSLSARKDESGVVVGAVMLMRDVTEAARIGEALQRSEERLSKNNARIAAILANVHEGVLTIDFQGVILSANPSCVWMFGYAMEELMGQRIDLLFPQISASLTAAGLFQALQDGLGVEPEVTNVVSAQIKSGALIRVEMSCKPVLVESESFCTVTLHDMTEYNAYESRLQQKIDELQLLQDSLNQTNNQLYEANRELSLLAHQDGLTGLANRRLFDSTLYAEWSRSQRDHVPLSIVMFDVDHFKRYNDGYGHQAGDECLILVGSAIKSVLRRPADFAARYGGEEFVVLLPNTDLQGATQVASGILEEMYRLDIPHANSPTHPRVTLSAGVACSESSNCTDEKRLLLVADNALYRAKQLGRNQVCVAEEIKKGD